MVTYSVFATEKYTVELEMKDGELIPQVLEVPAKKPIRIKIRNTGTSPVEFESTQLRKRKSISTGRKFCRCNRTTKTGSLHLL